MPGITASVSDLAGRSTARVGVVADTHVGEWRATLPPGVLDALRGVDVVLHAGDITEASVLRELATLAPVVAVQGDHDRAAGLVLPRTQVVEVAGTRIGLTHGRRPGRIEKLASIVSFVTRRAALLGLDRALRRRFGHVDAVVYGHLHLPRIAWRKGVLYFSPGAVHNAEQSPGFAAGGFVARRYLRFRRSLEPGTAAPAVGILDITPAGITPRILPLAELSSADVTSRSRAS